MVKPSDNQKLTLPFAFRHFCYRLASEAVVQPDSYPFVSCRFLVPFFGTFFWSKGLGFKKEKCAYFTYHFAELTVAFQSPCTCKN